MITDEDAKRITESLRMLSTKYEVPKGDAYEQGQYDEHRRKI